MDEKGWNQSELARQASLHLPKGDDFRRDAVHVYLNRVALPRRKYLVALSKALGVQPDDLLPESAGEHRMPYAMRPVMGESGMSYLQVDMKVSMGTALAVLQLLQRET